MNPEQMIMSQCPGAVGRGKWVGEGGVLDLHGKVVVGIDGKGMGFDLHLGGGLEGKQGEWSRLLALVQD